MTSVLVVDDSLTVRKTVGEHLRNAGFHVIGEAADGREAVRLTHQLRPDVVLMDVVMPGIDGLAATRQIMSEVPTPVIILSGYADKKETLKTLDAIAAGALEVCAKPVTGGPTGQEEWDRILMAVGAAARVAVTRLHHRANGAKPAASNSLERPARGRVEPRRKIVVIGASTGGPAAVFQILTQLPPNFPLPILVAIHCGRQLASSMASWYDRECSLKVSEARDGEPLPQSPGIVLLAPPAHDLRIGRGRTVLDADTCDRHCVPSVDELFTSAAEHYGDQTIGVLLTGMGSDGAEGMRHIRDRGGCTIAQDEASCVVFGMSGAAIRLGAAEHVAPLEEIPPLLLQLTGWSRAESLHGEGNQPRTDS